METPLSWVTCDGCGLPASPAHVAERLNRLELATRYRPIHISVLFVATAPLIRPEDDFYRPPMSREFFNRFMEAVEIPAPGCTSHSGEELRENDSARLAEFQRRGYYLSYLSECPVSMQDEDIGSMVARLGSTLLRRIRFNYRPRQIAVLGSRLSPLRGIFEKVTMQSAHLPLLDIPNEGDAVAATRFRNAFARLVPGANPDR